MKTDRRKFLKLSSLLGLGATGLNPLRGYAAEKAEQEAIKKSSSNRAGRFNMCGYAAPKIETVRIGFIGLGNRGPGAVTRMNKIDGVDIKGLCDV